MAFISLASLLVNRVCSYKIYSPKFTYLIVLHDYLPNQTTSYFSNFVFQCTTMDSIIPHVYSVFNYFLASVCSNDAIHFLLVSSLSPCLFPPRIALKFFKIIFCFKSLVQILDFQDFFANPRNKFYTSDNIPLYHLFIPYLAIHASVSTIKPMHSFKAVISSSIVNLQHLTLSRYLINIQYCLPLCYISHTLICMHD